MKARNVIPRGWYPPFHMVRSHIKNAGDQVTAQADEIWRSSTAGLRPDKKPGRLAMYVRAATQALWRSALILYGVLMRAIPRTKHASTKSTQSTTVGIGKDARGRPWFDR